MKYNKKILISVAIGAIALFFIIIIMQNSTNDFFSLTGIMLFFALAVGGIYVVMKSNIDSVRSFDEESESNNSISELSEKDYLNQIADDIHIIKIIVIAFAAIAIVVMLISLFSIFSIVNAFS